MWFGVRSASGLTSFAMNTNRNHARMGCANIRNSGDIRLILLSITTALTERNEMRDVGIGIINAILSTLILAMIALIAYMLTV